MAPDWQLWIDGTPRPGWTNMSIDLALLDRAEQQGESWLRLYRWKPGCLSFGRHEPASTRYDTERIRELGLDTVRRPTGGRAVWHEHELTYAVACPSERFGSLRGAYLEIHTLLVETLRGWGIEASLAPRMPTPALDAGACFSQSAGGEVLVRGRKVVGSAQRRRGRALLQHGSILLQDDQHRVSALLRVNLPAATVHEGAPPLGLLEPDDLAASVASSARQRWAGVHQTSVQLERVLEQAAQHYPRFRSDAWTWAR
jgi:lipoate-protein ligase A